MPRLRRRLWPVLLVALLIGLIGLIGLSYWGLSHAVGFESKPEVYALLHIAPQPPRLLEEDSP
jgi:hypothetical protein